MHVYRTPRKSVESCADHHSELDHSPFSDQWSFISYLDVFRSIAAIEAATFLFCFVFDLHNFCINKQITQKSVVVDNNKFECDDNTSRLRAQTNNRAVNIISRKIWELNGFRTYMYNDKNIFVYAETAAHTRALYRHCANLTYCAELQTAERSREGAQIHSEYSVFCCFMEKLFNELECKNIMTVSDWVCVFDSIASLCSDCTHNGSTGSACSDQ